MKTYPKDNMNEEEIIRWLEQNIIPISWEGAGCDEGRPLQMYSTGHIYRAGAMLEGGFFIPCVAFAHPYYFVTSDIEQIRPGISEEECSYLRNRFANEFSKSSQVYIGDIKKVFPSPYSLPTEFYNPVVQRGPYTRMGDLVFWARMSDNTRWQFRCDNPMFMKLPGGYDMKSIMDVHPGHFLDYPLVNNSYEGQVFAEMPFFWCYSEEIAVGEETLIGKDIPPRNPSGSRV